MGKFPPALGLKLPLDWREHLERGTLPAFAGDVYPFLRRLGFDYCEFGFGLDLPDYEGVVSLLRREALACREHGLGVALHPGPSRQDNNAAAWFSSEPLDPEWGREPYAGLEAVLRVGSLAAAASGGPVPVVLHPAQFVYGPDTTDVAALRRDLVQRSRLFFATIQARADESQAAVGVLVEHQLPPDPLEKLIRVGDTCAEVMEVVADCRLGICWDTGHYILSVERYGLDDRPPEGFLERVAAVHLHDVVVGQDHRPISRQSHRLREFMQLLQLGGFTGGVTLEYAASGIIAAGGAEQVLRESVEVLSNWASERL